MGLFKIAIISIIVVILQFEVCFGISKLLKWKYIETDFKPFYLHTHFQILFQMVIHASHHRPIIFVHLVNRTLCSDGIMMPMKINVSIFFMTSNVAAAPITFSLRNKSVRRDAITDHRSQPNNNSIIQYFNRLVDCAKKIEK